MDNIQIEVRCISCGDKKHIDGEESERLTKERDVPICETCFLPMIPTGRVA